MATQNKIITRANTIVSYRNKVVTGCVFPPETCADCVGGCYRISGYFDGDFPKPPSWADCAAGHAFAPGLCNGSGTPGLWNGSFPAFQKVISGGGGTTVACQWYATCDNTPTGTSADGFTPSAGPHGNNTCLSNMLINRCTLARSCTAGVVMVKQIDIFTFALLPGNTAARLWLGQNADLTNPEMSGVYTYISGGDGVTAHPSSVTVERC